MISDADRVEVDAPDLLEVGELGDLHPVEPYFPTQAPGAQGGRFPVVLHEADIVVQGVDAQGLEANSGRVPGYFWGRAS